MHFNQNFGNSIIIIAKSGCKWMCVYINVKIVDFKCVILFKNAQKRKKKMIVNIAQMARKKWNICVTLNVSISQEHKCYRRYLHMKRKSLLLFTPHYASCSLAYEGKKTDLETSPKRHQTFPSLCKWEKSSKIQH
jgi:hypothetical protein